VVYNKGSETITDMIKQRRRIFNGHYRLLEEENVKISHVTKSGLILLLFKYKLYSIKHIIWIFGGIGLELYSITLAHYDKIFNKINPVVWDIASSTKNLAGLQRRKK
jgi:cellulose synthase/poly-beta-1,6-N-acetylglucosamine synthase-like glycosyltransferase